MYLNFKEYLESVYIAQKLLRENMFDYVLLTNGVNIRKQNFLMIYVDFIADVIKIEIEMEVENNLSKIASINEYMKTIGNNEYFNSFKHYKFIIRFTSYNEFIKFFDKYILDLNN